MRKIKDPILALGLALGPFIAQSLSAEGISNKEILTHAMNALFRDFDEDAVRHYFAPDYIQHNPNVPTGLEPIIGVMHVLKEAGFDYTVHRMIEDGDLIVTHNTYHNAHVFGAETVVAFDLWRIKDGKVTEHWDSIIPYYAETASGRSQTDGMTEIIDLDKTDDNKALVKEFVSEVLINGNTSRMTEFFRQDLYDQHNPVVKDGPQALKDALKKIENNRIHRVIGEGNFVLTQSEGSWNAKPVAIYDLFRVDKGKIVEHWDVIQEIPAKMAHTNGMF